MRFKVDIAPKLGHLEEVHLWLDQLLMSFVSGRPLNAAERRRIVFFAEKIGQSAGILNMYASTNGPGPRFRQKTR